MAKFRVVVQNTFTKDTVYFINSDNEEKAKESILKQLAFNYKHYDNGIVLIDEKDLMHTDKASIIDITAFPEYQIFNAERKETDPGEEP
jgi:tRNA uridine 5-carbamoylmethylation protein Kti12